MASSRESRHVGNGGLQSQAVKDEIRLLKLVAIEIHAGRMSTAMDVVTALLRVAASLTSALGKDIKGVDVARKLEDLRQSFANFMWFKSVAGVHFDAHINRVTILPEYWDRYYPRTDEPADFRLNGEPKYRLVYDIFTQGGAEKWDMQWLISRLDGGHPKWLPEPTVKWWWQP